MWYRIRSELTVAVYDAGYIVASILAAPAVWAADTNPVVALGDPDAVSRTPVSESSPVAGSERGPSSLLAGSPPSLTPWAMPGTQRFGGTQVAMNDAAPLQVAQGGGTGSAGKE